MELNKQINATIQTISSVYMMKNIYTCPISCEYKTLYIENDEFVHYLDELLEYLNILFSNYLLIEGEPHKLRKYLDIFEKAYDDNVEEEYLHPRPLIRNIV